MAEGFLGRWSQRKQDIRAGKPLAEPLETEAPPIPASPVATGGRELAGRRSDSVSPDLVMPAEETQAAVPPPTMEEANNLTAQSDFAPFVARNVPPEVRNTAMKKLFTDPHYNVMDRLDIYIDDYSKPDPLPESMLRQMVSAQFLKLFEDEKKDPPDSGVRDDAHIPGVHSVAHSEQPPLTGGEPLTVNKPYLLATTDDHTDLRLQQNHATGPQEPGRSAE